MTVIDDDIIQADLAHGPVEDFDYLDTLWGDAALCGEKKPEGALNNDYIALFEDFVLEAVDQCEVEDDETVYDQAEYVTILEETLKAALRQIDVLVTTLMGTIIASAGIQFKKFEIGPFRNSFVKKMVSYSFTGVEPKSPGMQQKFYSIMDYNDCLSVYNMLPPELKPRAAEWLQMYASGLFKTEFDKENLPGTLT